MSRTNQHATRDKTRKWIVADETADWQTVDLVAYLTLCVVLVVAHTPSYQILAAVCIVVATCSKRARRSPWMWFSIVAAFAPRLITDWYHNEDHVYLTIYWCAALGLSLWKNLRQILECVMPDSSWDSRSASPPFGRSQPCRFMTDRCAPTNYCTTTVFEKSSHSRCVD